MSISNHCKKYQCSICHQKYSRLEEIRAHVKAAHLIHVTCPLCDKLFPNKLELLKHKKVHFQVAPNNHSKQTEAIHASKVKDKEADGEPTSSSFGENAEVGPPVNHQKYDSKNSYPHHANDFKSTVSEEKCTPSQDSLCDKKFTNLLSKFENLESSIFSEPSKPREDTNDGLAKRDKEGGEYTDISLSSSTENTCVPKGHHCNNTSISVTPKESEFSATEYADKEGASLNVVNVGSESCMIFLHNDTKNAPIPESVERPLYINSSLEKHLGQAKSNSQKSKEFNCNVRNKAHENIKGVQSHIKETHVNILICLLCNEKFSTRSQYLSHSIFHLDLPEGKKLDNGNLGDNSLDGTEKAIEMDIISPKIEKQKSKSAKAKEYKCKLCQEKYFSVEDVRIHVKKVHLAGQTCTLCDKIFANKHTLKEHEKTHFGYTSDSNLTQSNESNDNSSKVPSNNGSKNNSASLDKVHHWVPLAEPSSDLSDGDIDAHSESDLACGNNKNGEDCHKCLKCSLFFNSASALALHQKTHEKVLYKCGVCDFTSSSRETVIIHLNQECHYFRGDFGDHLC